MLEEVSAAIEMYQAKWQKMLTARKDQAFFYGLKPTAVAWKVEDFAELQRRMDDLRDFCDQIHMGWLNERWLVTAHLREPQFGPELRVVKLMQRRPNSKDPVGLDHMDFLIPAGSANAKTVLAADEDLRWTEEKNGDFCKWISVWFDGAEAKLRSDTTLDVCIAEPQAINEEVKKR